MPTMKLSTGDVNKMRQGELETQNRIIHKFTVPFSAGHNITFEVSAYLTIKHLQECWKLRHIANLVYITSQICRSRVLATKH